MCGSLAKSIEFDENGLNLTDRYIKSVGEVGGRRGRDAKMQVYVPAIGKKEDVKIIEVQSLVLDDGDFQVLLTGQALSNIEEELNIVFSLLRAYTSEFEIDLNMIKSKDYHIHLSNSRIVKEGESIGIGLFISIICAIKKWNKKISCLATGEIDLYGNILPIMNVEKKLQINLMQYEHIFIPESSLNMNEKMRNKISFINNIFDLYQLIKELENEMVNV